MIAFRKTVSFHRNATIRFAVRCERLSVIDLVCIDGGKCDLARCDLKCARFGIDRELFGYVIMAAVIDNRCTDNRHTIRTSMRCRCFGSKSPDIIGITVDHKGLSADSAEALFQSVIFRIETVSLHRNGILRVTVCYGKCSVVCCDIVICFLCPVFQGPGKRIERSTGQSLSAGEYVICAFSFRESVLRHRN